MKVIRNETVATFDIDDTLVLWNHFDKENKGQHFIDPHDGTKHLLVPHWRHIKLLKDFKSRGYTVIVWSGGGYEWAETVVKTLGLEKYVDICMTKVSKFIDDLQAEEVLGSRIYLKHEDE